MRMDDPVQTFAYLATELVKQHPSMAYLHLVEPRVSGYTDREVLAGEASTQIMRMTTLVSDALY